MWDLFQDAVYVFLFVLFLSTFVSAETRGKVRRALGSAWALAAPSIYRFVTGRVPPNLPRARIELSGPERSDQGSAADRRSERSPRSNAESEGSEGALPNAPARLPGGPAVPVPERDPLLPADVGELRQLAHVLVLYAKRPNKEAAILAATGYKKGSDDGYRRISALFDAAMEGAAREAAREAARPARDSGAPVRGAAATPTASAR